MSHTRKFSPERDSQGFRFESGADGAIWHILRVRGSPKIQCNSPMLGQRTGRTVNEV